MFRGPHRICVELSAGCLEILGKISIEVSAETSVDTKDGEIERDGLIEKWKIVGRLVASAVKVLQLISR